MIFNIFDYMTLKVIWWCIIGFVLIVYACSAGFDYGGTLLMPFLKKESQRRLVLNVLAPTWDGNMTWVIFIGGALFIVWSVVYSTVFSGLYAVMFTVLWSNFLRPPGFDYRSKIDNPLWRRFWDFALFVSSIIPMFMFGFIFGNLLMGMPFSFDPIYLRSYYSGNFWMELNWIGILSGLVSVCILAMHGCSYICLRTEGEVRESFQKKQAVFGVLFLILFTASGFVVAYHVPGYILQKSPIYPTGHPLSNEVIVKVGAWVDSYRDHWWKIIGPVFAYIGVFFAIGGTKSKNYAWGFWSSCLAVGGTILTAGFSLYPFIVPSSTKPNQSITVWNATSSYYSLSIIFLLCIILFVIIFSYKIWAYMSIWRKNPILTEQEILKDTHSFY